MSINKTSMVINKNLIFIASFLAMLLLPASFAFAEGQPWFTEPIVNNEALLSPGDNAYCNKGFMVENMGKENAEVQVILGNGESYYDDLLLPSEKLAYSLTPGGPFVTEDGRGTHIDDARIVNIGNEALKVHCK